ncbi:MAG: SH3 domain-containing protein [Planctomycetota bacterium]
MKKREYLIGRHRFVMLFTITFLFTLATVACLEKDNKQKKLLSGRVTVYDLNVRAGASTNYESVGLLQKDEEVIIEEEISYPDVPAWLKIKAPEKVKLYVAKQFVERVADNKGIIKENNVNIRAKASIKSTIVNQVKKGTQVSIIKEEGDFYQIKPPEGTSLYVAKTYIDILGEYTPKQKQQQEASQQFLTEQQWMVRFTDINLKIAQEHNKEVAVRDYTSYIKELENLEKTAPTNDLKNIALARLLKVKEIQGLVEDVKKKEIANQTIEIQEQPTPQTKKKGIPVFEKPEPIEEEFTFKATGYLEGVGLYFGRPSPYKLVNNKQIVCFIKTEKNLKKLIGKFVEVKGKNYHDKKGRNILELVDIKVIDDSF